MLLLYLDWLDGVECWDTTRWFKRSFNFGRRSTATVRPPVMEMDCTRSRSDGVTRRILAKGLDVLPLWNMNPR
jgi:hypothetical protein